MSSQQLPVPNVQNTGQIINQLISHNHTLPGEGFSAKFSPHEGDDMLAIGCYNGVKLLVSVGKGSEGNIVVNSPIPKEEEELPPVTCVRWRPQLANSKNKVILFTTSEGTIEYYHAPTLRHLFSVTEQNNSIHCCDFAPKGQRFVTAGKDCNLRLYDQDTKAVVTVLGAAGWNNRGHANRVFSTRFIDQNTIISGGWDSVLHLWDIREGKSVRSSYGPHVAGDSIDFSPDINGSPKLLIGCYAASKQIQLWDYKQFQMETSLNWTAHNDAQKVAYVYTACFRYDGEAEVGKIGDNQEKKTFQMSWVLLSSYINQQFVPTHINTKIKSLCQRSNNNPRWLMQHQLAEEFHYISKQQTRNSKLHPTQPWLLQLRLETKRQSMGIYNLTKWTLYWCQGKQMIGCSSEYPLHLYITYQIWIYLFQIKISC